MLHESTETEARKINMKLKHLIAAIFFIIAVIWFNKVLLPSSAPATGNVVDSEVVSEKKEVKAAKPPPPSPTTPSPKKPAPKVVPKTPAPATIPPTTIIPAVVEHIVQKKPKKIIQTYTKVLGVGFWYDVPRDNPFREHDESGCKYTKCEIRYGKENIEEADLVFVSAQDIVPVDEIQTLKVPAKQIWVWSQFESPMKSSVKDLSEYDNVFDWTATYSSESEIWTPIMLIKPIGHDDVIPDPNKNYAEGRTKSVIMFMSNGCDGYRKKLALKLKQHIDLDLYGGCKEDKDLPDCEVHSGKCQQIRIQYKFYLSIENSYCKDYISEKFYFDALKYQAVPIILNDANLKDKMIAPPKSYINILDFPNLKALAEYLKYLNSNDTAYNEYHAWRTKFKLGSMNRMCTACQALWTREAETKEKHKTVKLSEFWNSATQCQSYDSDIFQKYINNTIKTKS